MPASDRARSAVLILCDGLGAGFLGTYGNGWLSTPALDRLATRSLVMEYPWVDSTSPERVTRSILQGDHACSWQQKGRSLAAIANAADRESIWISDCPASMQWPCIAGFRECELFPVSPVANCAKDLESTEFFSFFSDVAETIDSLPSSCFITIYLSGLSSCWDAPWDMRAALADESDPAPGDDARPAQFELQPDDDPDRTLLALQSYAAQVATLDICLGSTLVFINEVFDPEQTLVIFAGTRGYPLGQHRAVGYRDELLYAEQLHVPLLWRCPATLREAVRHDGILQPSGIYPALASWLAEGDTEESYRTAPLSAADHFPSTGRALVMRGSSTALRVPAWYLVDESAAPRGSVELFVKPDDRWEVNNVASLCPDIVDMMRRELVASREAAQTGQWEHQPELPAELRRAVG